MSKMTSGLRQELNQARADFQQTKSEIARRMAREELSLDHRIRRNPLKSVAISAGLGFVIGGASDHMAVVLALLTGAVVGYSLAGQRPDQIP